MTKHWIIVAAAGLALAIGGCAKDQQKSDDGKMMNSASDSAGGLTASAIGAQPVIPKDPPISAQTHFAAGQLAEAQGNLAGAAQQYAKAAEQDESFLMAIYRLGVVYS